MPNGTLFYPLPTEDQGAKITALRAQLDSATARLGTVEGRLLNYPPLIIDAFDQNGDPFRFEALCRYAGSWPGFAPSTPWAVTVTADPSSPGNFLASVNLESDLLRSLQPSDNITVTGLNTPFKFVPGNDLVTLYLTITTATVTAAAIQGKNFSGSVSNFDPTKPAYDSSQQGWVVGDNGTPTQSQIGLNVLLAYSDLDGSGNAFFVQACTSHLVMQADCFNGLPTLIAVPSPYRRYGITS